jgi:hypothetical protein
LQNVIWVIESRRMRWTGFAARIEEVHTGFCWGNLKERVRLEDVGVDRKIILK